jgi:hypothetical protein
MKKSKVSVILATTLGAVVLCGCSKKEPPGRLADAPVDSVPVTPSTEANIIGQAADQAIKQKSYTEAVATVIQMGQTPGMTPEQLVAYKNLRRNLQLSLTEAAMAGDQKAQEAIQMLRMSTSPGMR